MTNSYDIEGLIVELKHADVMLASAKTEEERYFVHLCFAHLGALLTQTAQDQGNESTAKCVSKLQRVVT